MANQAGTDGLLSREFLLVAVATMAFFAAMGAANPVLPRFVDDELGAGEASVGIVLGAGAVASLLLRPWFGRLGDMRGPRLLMVVGPILGVVGYLALIPADSVMASVAARLPAGASIAAVMTGSTTLALEMSPDNRRGEAASYMLVSFQLGLGLGPLLGEAVLREWSYEAVWVVLSVMCLVATLVALTLPVRPIGVEMAPGRLLHPRGVVPGVVVALSMMAFIGFSVFVPLYAEEIDVDRVGPVFMVASVSIALVRLVAGKVPDRLGPMPSTTIALAAISAGCLVLAFWQSAGGLYLGAAVLAGGGALALPSLVPVAVEGVPANRRSSAMATFSMFIDVAAAVTGPLFGLIVAGGGYRLAYLSTLGTTLLAWLVLRLVLAPELERRKMGQTAEPDG